MNLYRDKWFVIIIRKTGDQNIWSLLNYFGTCKNKFVKDGKKKDFLTKIMHLLYNNFLLWICTVTKGL